MTVLLPTHDVTIQRPTGVEDGYGGVKDEFTDVGTVLASVQWDRRPGDGNQTDAGGKGRFSPSVPVGATIYAPPAMVRPGDRLLIGSAYLWVSQVQPTLDPTMSGALDCDVVLAVGS